MTDRGRARLPSHLVPRGLLPFALLAAACDVLSGPRPPLERVGAPVAAAGRADGAPQPARVRPGGGGPDSDLSSDAAPAEPGPPRPAEAVAAGAAADRDARAGRLDEALAGYERAVALDPGSAWARVAYGWLLSRAGRLGDAREEVERGLDGADHRDQLLAAAAHDALGELQEARGDMTRAQESYRLALRARPAPAIARALLRVMPSTSPRLDEVRRLAEVPSGPPWAGGIPPRAWASGDASALGALPLALAELPGGRGAAVVARRLEPGDGLPAGWAYRLVVGRAGAGEDAGLDLFELELAEAHAVRWHQATVEATDLGGGRQGLLAVVSWTEPGAGAPSGSLSTLAEAAADGLVLLLSRATAAERESPIGCRRGYRTTLSLTDGDDDGAAESVTLVRRDTVVARLPGLGTACREGERRRPPRSLALGTGAPRPEAGALAPDEAGEPDGG